MDYAIYLNRERKGLFTLDPDGENTFHEAAIGFYDKQVKNEPIWKIKEY